MSTNSDEDVSSERNEKSVENAVRDFTDESGSHSLSYENDQSSSSTTAETDLNLNLSKECKLEDMDESHLQTEVHLSVNTDEDVSYEQTEKAEENDVKDFTDESGLHSLSCTNDQSSTHSSPGTDIRLNLPNECKLEDMAEGHLQNEVPMSTNSDEDVSCEQNEKSVENALNDFTDESSSHSLSYGNDQNSSSTTFETDLNLNVSKECKLEDMDESHLQTEEGKELCMNQNSTNTLDSLEINTALQNDTFNTSLSDKINTCDSNSSAKQDLEESLVDVNISSSESINENIYQNCNSKNESFQKLRDYCKHKGIEIYTKIEEFLQKQDIFGIRSLNINDINLKSIIDDCIKSTCVLETINYSVLPLVTLQSEIQDRCVIDKMIINEETIAKLCNKLFKEKIFYKDPFAGNVIHFNELNHINCKYITIIGKFHNILEFLQSELRLTKQESFACYAKLQNFGSGIYLVNNLFTHSESEKVGFLCLFSENDSYYDNVTSKSKAIHFLRYMTMLSNHVIVLPNFEDVSCFSALQDSSMKSKRHSSYTVKQHQLQKEECLISDFGEMMLPSARNDWKISSSSTQGIIFVKIEKMSRQISYKSEFKILTAQQFWDEYNTAIFQNPESVDFSFKEKYLEFHLPNKYEDRKKAFAELERKLYETDEHSQFKDELILRISQMLFSYTFPLEHKLLQNCIKSAHNDSLSFKETNIDLIKDFPIIAKFELKKELLKLYDHSFKTHVGFEVLKYLKLNKKENMELVEKHTLDELKYKFIYPSKFKIFSYINIYNAIIDFSKNEENTPIFNFAIDNLISFLKKFGQQNVLKNLDSKFFIKNLHEKHIKKQREEQWKKNINSDFNRIVSKLHNNNSVSVDSIKQSIKSSNEFQVRLKTKMDGNEKIMVKFHKLCNVKDSTFSSSSIISRENHDILSIGCYELEATKTILSIYPCEANYFMLLINFKEQSHVTIVNAKNQKLIIQIPFGKPIALSSFDNHLRVLAIYSNFKNFNSISLYKFSTDFKSYNKLNQIDVQVSYAIEKINGIELQYQKKFLWILSNDNRINRIDYNTGNISIDKKFKPPKENIFHSMKIDPKGCCLFLFAVNNMCHPIMLETYTVLPTLRIEQNSLISNISGFTAVINYAYASSRIKFQKLRITTAKSELQIKKDIEEKSETLAEKFHWLYYFYWMFVKFPCDDLLKLNQRQLKYSYLVSDTNVITKDFENCLQFYMSRIKNSLLQTSKPLHFIGLINKVNFKNWNTFSLNEIEEVNVGEFIKQLICLVPRQIARCQFSEFYILNDGEELNINESNDVFDLKDKISLGLFEAVLNSWHKEVKVLSSMGKQSTGKSYTLNHLTGSSYDISGSRCTDGCWLTLKVTDTCLYVVLDFEGLGSFERTDQDDMLLSLFNSAISNMTLFKTEYRLDKDVDQMFSRFNLGSSQMKDNEHLFQGRFFIIIKDVAEQDIDDVQHEFEEKITTIITKESEKNFISKLYQSGFDILPFSMFQLEEYYYDMENLCNIMKNDVRGTFYDGASFLDFLKLLLSKLAINDFTSIGRQQIDGRIKYLRNCMNSAIVYGQISSDIPKTDELDLRNLDDVSIKIARMKTVYLNNVSREICLNDFEFIFINNYFCDIVLKYSGIVPLGNNNKLWRLGLEEFLSEALRFRFERVQQWIHLNTEKIKLESSIEVEDICSGLEDYFAKLKGDLCNSYQFCNESCSKCFLKCTKQINHYEEHSCSTDHQCNSLCIFCEQFKDNYCKYPMGHEGKHHCSKVNHMCGQTCKYIEINNCKNECQLECNHAEEHVCSLKSHICNHKCSLPDCTSTCNINCDIAHEIHKCIKEQCIRKCCIENCTNKCTALDHFHSTDLSFKFKSENNICDEESFSELHFCGNEHKCDQQCAIDGYCKVTVEKSVVDVEFIGARDKFTYKRQFVQNGEKLNCLKSIKPFETKHDGDHICSNDANKVHICMHICPTCENICDKPFGHDNVGDNLHNTSHGNMVHCSFIANVEDFNVGSHKYKVGEPAIAEMCHIFCNSLGRGHIHVIECDKHNEECVYDAQDDLRRHETCQYGPDFNVEKDEIQHTEYWDTIGWQDPCMETDISEFGQCPCFCSSEEHESQIFCVGELWHEPYKSFLNSGITKGTLTNDGHLFPCEHGSQSFHFVLALDGSGSMGGSPWNSLIDSVNAFVSSRQTFNSNDMISIIVYSSSSNIVAEYIELSKFTTDMLQYIGNGTCFSLALKDVDDIIGRNLTKLVTPILIFMSDGCADDGELEMEEIARKYNDNKFQCYTVGFGSSWFDKLRKLASLGGGYFLECSTDLKLKNAFVEIAAKHPSTVSVIALK